MFCLDRHTVSCFSNIKVDNQRCALLKYFLCIAISMRRFEKIMSIYGMTTFRWDLAGDDFLEEEQMISCWIFQVSTRVLSLEGTASERWVGFCAEAEGFVANWPQLDQSACSLYHSALTFVLLRFAPGILYFRNWHRIAKVLGFERASILCPHVCATGLQLVYSPSAK